MSYQGGPITSDLNDAWPGCNLSLSRGAGGVWTAGLTDATTGRNLGVVYGKPTLVAALVALAEVRSIDAPPEQRKPAMPLPTGPADARALYIRQPSTFPDADAVAGVAWTDDHTGERRQYGVVVILNGETIEEATRAALPRQLPDAFVKDVVKLIETEAAR